MQRRAVTLDGDVVDPAGTLTGGSRAARGSVLAELHALAGAQKRLGMLEGHLAKLDEKLARLTQNADRWVPGARRDGWPGREQTGSPAVMERETSFIGA